MTIHVLLVTDLFPHRGKPHHGAGVAELAAELARHMRVTVLSPRYFSPVVPRGNWLEAYRGQEARVEREGVVARYPLTPALPQHFTTAMQGWAMAAAFTLPALWAGRVDLVHSFGVMPPGMPSAWLSRVLRVPLVVTATGSDVTFFPGVPHLRPSILRILGRARAATAVSRDLCGVVGGLGAKAEFIPMGIPSGLADPAAAQGPRESGTIVYLGRLEPWKGAQHAVAAMRLLPEARLMVIGAGSMESTLPKEAGANVRFLGALPTPEVHAWLRRAAVVCMPSEREGWPVTCLEALACGAPVVAARVGGLPEILTEERLGILTAPRDPAALAAALREAIGRYWDRAALVAHAAGYAWGRIAGRYAEVYEKAVS